jgi:CheY-like chemotaxis protein
METSWKKSCTLEAQEVKIMNAAHTDQDASCVPPHNVAPALTPGNITILVVEDEDFVREVTAEVLLSAGFRVLRARTAAEAMRLFPRNGDNLHLLLTDVVLPGRSGYLLAHDLRVIVPALKVIFISGYPENEVIQRVSNHPANFYLPKPYSVEMLLQKVKVALSEPAEAPAQITTEVAPQVMEPAPNTLAASPGLRIHQTVIHHAR